LPDIYTLDIGTFVPYEPISGEVQGDFSELPDIQTPGRPLDEKNIVFKKNLSFQPK
jgi:hypothetical protein